MVGSTHDQKGLERDVNDDDFDASTAAMTSSSDMLAGPTCGTIFTCVAVATRPRGDHICFSSGSKERMPSLVSVLHLLLSNTKGGGRCICTRTSPYTVAVRFPPALVVTTTRTFSPSSAGARRLTLSASVRPLHSHSLPRNRTGTAREVVLRNGSWALRIFGGGKGD